jgi:predicted nucleic acid-binding protein
MSLYVLETDHLSPHLRGHQRVRERLALTAPDSVAITIVTAEEQLRGRLAQISKAAAGSARSTACGYLHRAITDLAKLNILDYDAAAHVGAFLHSRKCPDKGAHDAEENKVDCGGLSLFSPPPSRALACSEAAMSLRAERSNPCFQQRLLRRGACPERSVAESKGSSQ